MRARILIIGTIAALAAGCVAVPDGGYYDEGYPYDYYGGYYGPDYGWGPDFFVGPGREHGRHDHFEHGGEHRGGREGFGRGGERGGGEHGGFGHGGGRSRSFSPAPAGRSMPSLPSGGGHHR